MSHFMHEITILMGKLKVSLWAIIGIITASLTPIIPLLLLVGCAIVADTIFGIYKAYKLKLLITSRKMGQLVSKMVLYQGAIVSLFFLEKFLLGEFTIFITSIPFIITKLATITLLYIEGTSINEHIIKLYNVSIWGKFKELLKRSSEIKDDIKDVVKND